MPEQKDIDVKKTTSLPFESSDTSEQELWSALGDLPAAEPSPNLRRSFYQQLERANSLGWSGRLGNWLGISGNSGWVTATACLLIGFGAAQMAGQQTDNAPERLAVMEENIALLNRELILDRLQDDTAGTRLMGIHAASYMVQDDNEIAQALLRSASSDRSSSVRSAAIDALAPQLNTPSVGAELMNLLSSAESPIVQLALVDLVLRNGDNNQLDQLLKLADENKLHPDLVRHVNKSLRSETI